MPLTELWARLSGPAVFSFRRVMLCIHIFVFCTLSFWNSLSRAVRPLQKDGEARVVLLPLTARQWAPRPSTGVPAAVPPVYVKLGASRAGRIVARHNRSPPSGRHGNGAPDAGMALRQRYPLCLLRSSQLLIAEAACGALQSYLHLTHTSASLIFYSFLAGCGTRNRDIHHSNEGPTSISYSQ